MLFAKVVSSVTSEIICSENALRTAERQYRFFLNILLLSGLWSILIEEANHHSAKKNHQISKYFSKGSI
jgi:hypothetical protein